MVLTSPSSDLWAGHPASMSDHTASTGGRVANQPSQSQQLNQQVQDEVAPVVIDSGSIVLLENDETQAQPVRRDQF